MKAKLKLKFKLPYVSDNDLDSEDGLFAPNIQWKKADSGQRHSPVDCGWHASIFNCGRSRPQWLQSYTYKLNHVFQEHGENIWLTTDGWSSQVGAFVIITKTTGWPILFFYYWPFLNGKIWSNKLGTSNTWKLDKKTSRLVGDNTKSMPKTRRLIAEEDGFANFQFWGCVAHLINLLVKNALTPVCWDKVLTIRLQWKKWWQSPEQ